MDYLSKVKQRLISKPEVAIEFPFDNSTKVYKVKNKMFALLGKGKGPVKPNYQADNLWLNLKCDPDEAIMLRDIFPSIIAGYHMNKRHWNTVILDQSIPIGEIERMIDNSFELVVSNMPKAQSASISLHQ